MPHGEQEVSNFDTPPNFIFDSGLIEFTPIATPVVAQLKASAELTFAATYNGTADANDVDAAFSRDSGSLVGTAAGGAVIDLAGSLNLIGSREVTYPVTDNVDQLTSLGTNENGCPESSTELTE